MSMRPFLGRLGPLSIGSSWQSNMTVGCPEHEVGKGRTLRPMGATKHTQRQTYNSSIL